MTLNDKIVTIIEGLSISNTKFADAIDVSRPTISHIISGRNKPSIDIIQKIIAKYPELGYKWFLDEEELDLSKLAQITNNEEVRPPKEPLVNSLESNISKQTVPKAGKSYAETLTQNVNERTFDTSQRRVERVIMFYNDGSMEVLSGTAQVL